MKPVRKAVIPAAGLGTRFLPATKSIPKEMLPIVDKPTIQYVVEEAVESGFEDILFVTAQGKNAIEDHFDHDQRLERQLKEQGKDDLLELVTGISKLISIFSVRQKRPLGLGHAVQVAQAFVGREAFGVFLGDDIIHHPVPCMKQLVEAHVRQGATVLAVQEVARENVSRYGVVGVDSVADPEERLFRVRDLVEKPSPAKAPSRLAIIGRYILTPGIFDALQKTRPGAGGEIQLTDALQLLLKEEPIYACRFQGRRYDAGNKLEYLMATVDFALQRTDLKEEFARFLKGLEL